MILLAFQTDLRNYHVNMSELNVKWHQRADKGCDISAVSYQIKKGRGNSSLDMKNFVSDTSNEQLGNMVHVECLITVCVWIGRWTCCYKHTSRSWNWRALRWCLTWCLSHSRQHDWCVRFLRLYCIAAGLSLPTKLLRSVKWSTAACECPYYVLTVMVICCFDNIERNTWHTFCYLWLIIFDYYPLISILINLCKWKRIYRVSAL